MNPLFDAAHDFLAFCRAHGWKCCVIGGLAVQRWGEPRQTRDVDLTLLADLGAEEGFIDPILASYRPRFSDARGFALERRVLFQTSTGVPLDVSLGALPYEARVIARSSLWRVDAATALSTCSAEDLVVLKAFAGRPQDWLDVEGVLVRQGPSLNRGTILDELRPLVELKDDSAAEPRLLELFAKHPA